MDNPNQVKHGSSNGPRRFRPQARSNKPRRLRRVLSSGLTRFRQVSKRKRWDILHFVKASVESETVTFLAHASCKLKSTPNENVCCGASFERNLQRFLYTRMTSVQTQNDGIIDWFRNGDVPLTRPLVFQRCPSGEFLTFSQGHMLNAKPYVVAMLTLQCYTRKMAANAFSQSNQRDVKGHQGTSRDMWCLLSRSPGAWCQEAMGLTGTDPVRNLSAVLPKGHPKAMDARPSRMASCFLQRFGWCDPCWGWQEMMAGIAVEIAG